MHTEVTETSSTEGTNLAIQRLISHRGRPENIRLDSGTGFFGANNTLKAGIAKLQNKASVLQDVLLHKGVPWFSTSAAHYSGGPWEKLIRIFEDTIFTIAVR